MSIVKANSIHEISKYSHQELQIANNCNFLTNAQVLKDSAQETKAAETSPDKLQLLKTLFQYKMMQTQMQMQSKVPNNLTFYNLPQNAHMTHMTQMHNFPAMHVMNVMPQSVAPQINSGFPMMAAPQMNYGFFPNTNFSQNFNNYMTAPAGFPSHSTQVHMTSYPAMACPSFGYNPNTMFQ